MKYTIEHHSGLALLHYGSECRPATDVEVDLVAQLEKATASLAAVETQRPHWAKGYTDDSVAAQCATAALSQLWKLIGATNQTQAVLALQKLSSDRFFVIEYAELPDEGGPSITRRGRRDWPEWVDRAWPQPCRQQRRASDRQRFPDKKFNEYLDQAITENGEHTTWDQIGNVNDAWYGYQAGLHDAASELFDSSNIYEAYQTWPEDLRARLSLQDLRRMSGWKPKSKEDQVIDIQEKAGVISAEEAVDRRVRQLEPKGPDDAARLDWLERKAGKSYTGLTIDMRGDLRGFRLMWHHYATNGGHNNLRSAIDQEMAHEN